MPQYFDDFETYKSELEKLGANKIEYNTEPLEGSPNTTITKLSWCIDDNKYSMTIVDHHLRDYQQMCKRSCVASALAEQEKRLPNHNEVLTEKHIMNAAKASCDEGMFVHVGLDVFLKQTSVYRKIPAYIDFLDDNDHGLTYYEKRSFIEMERDNGVFFKIFNDQMDHAMNASRAISFLLNNQEPSYEIILWDSDFNNGKIGGFKSLTLYDWGKFYGKMGTLFKK